MSEDMSGKGLVPSGKGGLVQRGSEGNKLIRRAASDALVPIQTMMNQRTTTLHRVGTREFYDEDFRQLQVWASEFGMDGRVSDFVDTLDRSYKKFVEYHKKFVEDCGYKDGLEEAWCQRTGSFLNFIDWYSDGRINAFVEFGEEKISFPKLSNLTHLELSEADRGRAGSPLSNRLELSSVPALIELFCDQNQLTEIDLFGAPNLKQLSCTVNELKELNLFFVPKLTHLHCDANSLTKLDLSCVPDLVVLMCCYNQLTELNLSFVPNLKCLTCSSNGQITDLDLSSVPDLEFLDCGYNQLTNLNLSNVPNLRSLDYSGNPFMKIDLFQVPGLEELMCQDNQLTELDLSAVPGVRYLWCGGNKLSELDIRSHQHLHYVVVDPWVVVHKRPDQSVQHRLRC